MSHLKKADYIAQYGEDAWKLESKRRYQFGKNWRSKNPEYNKKWKKEYRDNNTEKCREKDKKYYSENAEKAKERSRAYKSKNIQYYTNYNKEYYKTQKGRAIILNGSYIESDKAKGFSTDQNIDEKWIIENIFNSSCIYCGESDWAKLGVDRIDNTKGHTPDNCVCACERCNKRRQDKYSVEEFVEKMKKEKGGE